MSKKIYLVTINENDKRKVITATTDEEQAYRIRNKFYNYHFDKQEKIKVEEYDNADFLEQTCWEIHLKPNGKMFSITDVSKFHNRYLQPLYFENDGYFCVSIVENDMEIAIQKAKEKFLNEINSI